MKKELSFPLLLSVAAFALRVFRIDSQSLWIDEMLTLTVSTPTSEIPIWDYLKYNIHGPLHSFVVFLFQTVSMNDGWLRLPSALAGAAAVFYFYRWIQIWLGTGLARLAGLLLVIHPLHIHYSQELRNYSFLFLFGVMSSYYLHKLLSASSKKRTTIYILTMAAAALSNFAAAFLFVVHSALFLFRKGDVRQRLYQWFIVSIVILVLISPWVYRVYTFIDVSKLVTPVKPGQIDVEERLRGETTFSSGAVPYLFYTFSVGFTMGPSTRELHRVASMASVIRLHWAAVLWVGLLFGMLATLGVRYLVRSERPWLQVLLYLFVPLMCTLILNWQNAKAFNVRYVLLALPPFLCLVAAGILALPIRRWAVAAVAATMLLSINNYYFNGDYAREDVRQAARDIQGKSTADECILAPTVSEVFSHYYKGTSQLHEFYAPRGTTRVRLSTQLEKIFANCDRLWYVRARDWVDDPNGEVIRALDAEYVRSELIEYNGVTVIQYMR